MLFDLLLLVIAAGFAYLGYRTGPLGFLAAFVGGVGGFALAVAAAPTAAAALPLADRPRSAVILAGLVLAIILGETVLSSLVGRLAARFEIGRPRHRARLLGAALSSLQVILVAWLAGGLLATGPAPFLAQQVQTSRGVRLVNGLLPPSLAVFDTLTALLDPAGGSVFIGLEPAPAEPVPLPDRATVTRIGNRAAPSIYRVTSEGCPNTFFGTAFAVAPDYLVTNAHVVAGGKHILVDRGASHPATVVLYDPGWDLAVLHVAGLKAPPLAFAASEPGRGEQGAALGHPGGQGLTVLPAGVTASYPAFGRDLYGTSRLTRQIIELAAAIEGGDSGGPVVGTDGRVMGLVFAASHADPGVGYALSPTAVAAHVQAALGATAAVSTDACLAG